MRTFICSIFFASTLAATPIASIIKVTPKEVAKNQPSQNLTPYKDLVCTDQDKRIVAQIITTMGENNKLSLLIKKGELENLGTQINHLHPLKFLSAIFTNPSLKVLMFSIFQDTFKREGFLGGLTPGLTRDANEGKLLQYAPDFAAELKVDPEKIKEFFRTQKWDAMVRYLIES